MTDNLSNEQSSDNPNRLRWQCRRGLLELDLMFNAFLDRGYEDLDARQQERFQAFLKEPDPQLLTWLMTPDETTPEIYAELIQRIRHSIVTGA